MRTELAAPVLVGRKTSRDRFAGATNTLTCEGMMGDGKALQMATSHELGQNFARAFDIGFLGPDKTRHLAWTTSWGSSTRIVGGLIMIHGDDSGLRLPPRLAPTEVVVLPVREKDDSLVAEARALAAELAGAGLRTRVDASAQSFGRRVIDWELKGAPVRVELGPRDLAEGVVTLARRDTSQKTTVPRAGVAAAAADLLGDIQATLLAQAEAAMAERTHDVHDLDAAVEVATEGAGFARLAWAQVGSDGEDRLAKHALSVRCIQRSDGTIPDSEDEPDLVCIVARAY
jgi:prolyl-tRNA synthetase